MDTASANISWQHSQPGAAQYQWASSSSQGGNDVCHERDDWNLVDTAASWFLGGRCSRSAASAGRQKDRRRAGLSNHSQPPADQPSHARTLTTVAYSVESGFLGAWPLPEFSSQSVSMRWEVFPIAPDRMLPGRTIALPALETKLCQWNGRRVSGSARGCP